MCDFNLSRRMPAFGNLTKSAETPNSPAWQSPEVLAGSDYNTQSDVFSFGVILWEILTLGIPWAKDDRQMHLLYIMNKVKEGFRLEFPPLESIPGPPLAELPEVRITRGARKRMRVWNDVEEGCKGAGLCQGGRPTGQVVAVNALVVAVVAVHFQTKGVNQTKA